MLRRDINDYHFMADAQTGLTMRWGKTLRDDPTWAPVPELADISISNHCTKGCSYCYRKSENNSEFMSLEDYCYVLDAINHPTYGNVFQVAIGGGEPLEHPEFIQIIDETVARGIVVNFTTNGIHLSADICLRIQGKVGAVALSISRMEELNTEKIRLLAQHKIRVNLHYVLSSQNIDEAIKIVQGKYNTILNGVNAIIFLTYKPAGRANKNHILKDGAQLAQFISAVNAHKKENVKIGFDACFIPMLLHSGFNRPELVDTCEAGLFSVYIDHKLNVSPCSFSGTCDRYNLREYSFYDIWEEKFSSFRDKQINQCMDTNCPAHKMCNGCCPYYPEITTCYANND